MRCQTKPTVDRLPFAVSRVRSKAHLRTAISIASQGHAIDEAIVARVLARDPAGDDGVSAWIAWEGAEPISVAWLTDGDHIGAWSMMTPPVHRRRGAARAVLGTALAESWRPSTRARSSGRRPPVARSTNRSASTRSTSQQSGYAPGSDIGLPVGQPP